MKTKFSKSGVPYLHFGKGEPLVLIHGLGEVKEGWQNQFELSDQYELIIPDLRGHGENYKSDISIQNFAKDIIELLHELDIHNAHICGLSMGGAVAQEIYRQKPNLCRSLILNSTFHYMPDKLGKIVLDLKKGKYDELTTEQIQNQAAKLSLYSWKDNVKDQFKQFFIPRANEFIQSAIACTNVNNLRLLPKINVPTLVIGCQYDSILPPSIQLHMHKLIPNSEFVILRNSGHIAKLEATDRYNNLLRRFIGSN
jgi:pimeloyl-ACP methyl ester carboxylesterase